MGVTSRFRPVLGTSYGIWRLWLVSHLWRVSPLWRVSTQQQRQATAFASDCERTAAAGHRG